MTALLCEGFSWQPGFNQKVNDRLPELISCGRAADGWLEITRHMANYKKKNPDSSKHGAGYLPGTSRSKITSENKTDARFEAVQYVFLDEKSEHIGSPGTRSPQPRSTVCPFSVPQLWPFTLIPDPGMRQGPLKAGSFDHETEVDGSGGGGGRREWRGRDADGCLEVVRGL